VEARRHQLPALTASPRSSAQGGAPQRPANYRAIFDDNFFWTVLERTVIWTTAMVVATMVIASLLPS